MADPYNYSALYGETGPTYVRGEGGRIKLEGDTRKTHDPMSVFGDPNARPNQKLKALLDYETKLLAENPYGLGPSEQQQQQYVDQATRAARSQATAEQTAANRAALAAPDFRQGALQDVLRGSEERVDQVTAQAHARNAELTRQMISDAYQRTVDGLVQQREYNMAQTQMWLKLGLGTAATVGSVLTGLGTAGILGTAATNIGSAVAGATQPNQDLAMIDDNDINQVGASLV